MNSWTIHSTFQLRFFFISTALHFINLAASIIAKIKRAIFSYILFKFSTLRIILRFTINIHFLALSQKNRFLIVSILKL